MFVATADLHLRDKTPKYRCDDFCTNQFLKFQQLLEYTVSSTTNILVVAGDVFDSKGVNYATVVRAMSLIMSYNVEILLVPGQHDLRYHRKGLDGTPLGVLLQLNNVHLLNSDKAFTSDTPDMTFVGAGWNEEPEAKADVLVTHRMVTEDGPLWPGHTDYISSKALLKQYKEYKFIISGDNHRPHKTKLKERVNINCGSMCRTNKDQYNYKPAFWHVQESGKVTKVPFGIQKASEVFDKDKIVRDEKFEENKQRFNEVTDNISTKAPKPNFERILLSTIKEAGASSEAEALITSKMEELNG